MIMVLLGQRDLLARQLAVGDRVHALDALRHVAVGDALHFQHVQAAELGDLLERQGSVLHQPDGGGLGHQGAAIAHRVLSLGPARENRSRVGQNMQQMREDAAL
jgi:hypothetical protein